MNTLNTMYKPVLHEDTLAMFSTNTGVLQQYTMDRDNTVPEVPQRPAMMVGVGQGNRPESEIYQSIHRQASLLG